MKRIRLTMSQALVKFLDNQYIECDGVETKFVSGMFGIFGHGCVVGVGQALEQGGHNLKFYQGKNEQIWHLPQLHMLSKWIEKPLFRAFLLSAQVQQIW